MAALLPRVAVIGTPADLQNDGTYFGRDFGWPAHARNYVGVLDLRDTAALIGQCAALVSNDSGLMHLAVALGVPTFGVFGLTSPAREGLPCEPACRREPWGRRDCAYHLKCLKTLTAGEVFGRLCQAVPAVASVEGSAARG